MKIMIVDDSRAMRMIVGRTLKQAGFGSFKTVEAENGAEAYKLIEQDRPDLILSDWNMPEMKGIELLEKLAEEEINIPFGFVTSESSPESHQRAKDAGTKFIITKPFTPEKFEAALSPIFEEIGT